MYPDNDPGDQPYNRYGTFNEYQRNKKSLTLDLSRDDCREVARGLIPIADVVMENYSARVMRNFGLDYPTVRPLNPAIIFVSMPGFGTTGPHRNHVSYGTNIEPTAGFANMMGYPGPVPYKSGEAYPDPNAGVNAVAAVLTALYYRRRSGKGQFIDLSQNEATTSLIGEALLGYQLTGEHPVRMGNHHAYHAPHNAYRCKGEDNWVTIAVTNDEEWGALCEVAGNPDWSSDPRFQDQLSRWQHQDDIDHTYLEMDRERGLQRLDAPAPRGRGHGGGGLHEPGRGGGRSAQRAGIFLGHPTRSFGNYAILRSASPSLQDARNANQVCAPLMGEHNRYVLEDLAGLEKGYVDSLESEGAIGTRPPEGIPGVFA